MSVADQIQEHHFTNKSEHEMKLNQISQICVYYTNEHLKILFIEMCETC